MRIPSYRSRTTCALILTLAASLAAFAQAGAHYAKANKETVHCYVMLIRLRGDLYGKWKTSGRWPDDPDANRALSEHSRYWDDQLANGRAILAGGMNGEYWDNVALIVFEAASQAEAEAVFAADPAVKAFVFQAQVRPFDMSFITNKFESAGAAPAGPKQ